MRKTITMSAAVLALLGYSQTGKEQTKLWRRKRYWECVDCEARFAQYQIDFSKSYATAEEEAMRFYYFKKSVRKIDYINGMAVNDDDLRLELNEFSDWSGYEFRALKAGYRYLREWDYYDWWRLSSSSDGLAYGEEGKERAAMAGEEGKTIADGASGGRRSSGTLAGGLRGDDQGEDSDSDGDYDGIFDDSQGSDEDEDL